MDCPWQVRTGLAALALLFAPVQASAVPIDQQISSARALAAQCRFSDAITGARAALAAAQTSWPAASPQFALIHADLAGFLSRSGDLQGAEAEARAAVAIASAPDPNAAALRALAQLRLGDALLAQQRPGDAEPHLTDAHTFFADTKTLFAIQSAIALSRLELRREKPGDAIRYAQEAVSKALSLTGPSSVASVDAGLQLIDAYRWEHRLEEARKVAEELGAVPSVAQGGRYVLVMANLAFDEGRFADSLSLLEKAQSAAQTKSSACDTTILADILQAKGSVHLLRREISEARQNYEIALDEIDRLQLARDPRRGEILFGLADAAYLGGDFDIASKLFDRAADAYRSSYGLQSPAVAQTLVEKGFTLVAADQPDLAIQAVESAEPILRATSHAATPAHASASITLGLAYKKQGRIDAARNSLQQGLSEFEKLGGSESFDLPPGLISLAEIELASHNPAAAISLLNRAYRIQVRTGSSAPLALGLTYARFAEAYSATGDKARALDFSAKAVESIRIRLVLGESLPWMDAEAERRRSRQILEQDLRLNSAVGQRAVAADRIFQTTQLISSMSTGAAIAQMSRRLQSGNGRLAAMLRQRDDLSEEWRRLEREKTEALASGAMQRPESGKSIATRQMAALDRLSVLDRNMRTEFPATELVIRSSIVSATDVQPVLGATEAAITFAPALDATYVTVVTRSKISTFRASLGKEALASTVLALRQSIMPREGSHTVPQFDAGAAYRLFDALLKPANAVLGGIDTLLLVPDGPLSSIPFGILISEAPKGVVQSASELAALDWLTKRYAIDVFPSAASIVILRRLTKQHAAESSFLGVGAPQFGGRGSEDAPALIRRSVIRNGLADPRVLNLLPPLPDAREELMTMAETIGLPSSRLLLGKDATETAVKNDPLRKYRILGFATHGLIAGDLAGYAEPALVLSPPASPSAEDDGLLSASEVATLRLDADWVILSACNTAEGSSVGAEPLTGLAKAFFYAGARSLLVSHWPVESRSAVLLTTATIARFAKGITAAQALRRAQLSMINDDDGSHRTHPFFWGPFSLVGSTGESAFESR